MHSKKLIINSSYLVLIGYARRNKKTIIFDNLTKITLIKNFLNFLRGRPWIFSKNRFWDNDRFLQITSFLCILKFTLLKNFEKWQNGREFCKRQTLHQKHGANQNRSFSVSNFKRGMNQASEAKKGSWG